MKAAFYLGQREYLDVTNEIMPKLDSDTVIGFECPLTITLGRRSAAVSEETVNLPKDARVVQVERGGHATLHNLGQLVVYPKVDLNRALMGVREFVYITENCIIKTLSHYGLHVVRRGDQPGLYSEKGKIAFLGLRIKGGIVHHGLSINVCNNLADFSFIRSCGKWNDPVASLKTHGIDTSPEELFYRYFDLFSEYFPLTHPTTEINLKQLNNHGLRV